MSVRSHPEVVSRSAAGDVLGSFALTHELGAGLLTSVHAALRLTDGAERSVKRLHAACVQDAQARALLLAAGRCVAGVSAPFLVAVHEVHEEPEPYLVLERVEGLDLAALLANLSPRDAARVAIPVLIDALHGLHTLHTLRTPAGQAPLVHGAPHARHILVGADGRGRILDLTHAVGPGMPWSAGRDPRLEPRLMAPEQVLAPAHIDPRADVYVVGSVLWQALTGRPLFRGVGSDGAPRELLQHAPPLPSELGINCGKGLDRVCARALQRARTRRFASAAEMAAALREEAGRSISPASPDEIAALVSTLESRPRGAEAAQLAARVTLLGVGGREPDLDATATRRSRTAESPNRARHAAPSAAPMQGVTEQFAAPLPRPPQAARVHASDAAPTTQLEFAATTGGVRHPALRLGLPVQAGPAALHWQPPSPSIAPRDRARIPTAGKVAIMGLALALPALGLSLGFSVRAEEVRAVLARRFGVVLGAAGTGEQAGLARQLEASPMPMPAVALPTAPSLLEAPSEHEPSAAEPAPLEKEHAPPPPVRAAGPLQRARLVARPEARRAPKSMASGGASLEGSASAPGADGAEQADDSAEAPATRLGDHAEPAVPANPY